MKELFQIKEISGSSQPVGCFDKKSDAKKVRDDLNKGQVKFCVTLGRDHYRYSK